MSRHNSAIFNIFSFINFSIFFSPFLYLVSWHR
nr:MAG TPA: hypothetical protein [Caudoviricetes sp.]